MKNFIGVYTDAVDEQLCDWLCKVADQSSYVCVDNKKSDRNDTQIILESFHPTQANDLVASVNKCLMEYISNDVPFLSGLIFISSITLLQKTVPLGGGFHNFHAENSHCADANRALVWTIYLNDLPDGEGETEFLYEKIRIQPKKGVGVIFPSAWMYQHRGNPVHTHDKYITTGWYWYPQERPIK